MLGKAFKCVRQTVTACDLFSTTELLRYKENPEFKSANGGLCSIAVIAAFAIIFTQTILSTFAKSKISSQTTLFEETQPSHYTTEDSPFMFAVGVVGYNLNNATTKFFNIELSQYKVTNGSKKSVSYNLEPCNRSDWVNFDASLGSSYDIIGLNTYLCLPPNVSFAFAGKYTSSIFQYMKIVLKDCKILAGDNRTCVNSSLIDANIAANGPISFNYYFINTIINPDSPQYLGTYLEDRNYFTFTRTMGTSANLYISSYTIETDESLWPWQQMSEDTGGIVYEPTQRYVYTPTTEYIRLYLRKSSLSLSITRSFKKYDDTLSYIGGLFSSFMVCLFAMTKYNQYCYEIEIASKIYKYKQNKLVPSHKFNLLSCTAYCFYCILDFIGLTPQWPTLRQFDEVREEIGKQLDLKLILRKISFLEDCITYVFQDYELQCLHLKGKMSLEEAETIRKRFSSRKHLLKLKKKYPNAPSDDISIEDSKQINNMSTNQVYDFSRLKNNDKATLNLTLPVSDAQILEKSPHLQEDADSVDSDEAEERELEMLAEWVQSIEQVKEEARQGNLRCQKIYSNLDKIIKAIPGSVRLPPKPILNETQEKIQIKAEKEFTFLNHIEFAE